MTLEKARQHYPLDYWVEIRLAHGPDVWQRAEDKTGCQLLISDAQRDFTRWMILSVRHDVSAVRFVSAEDVA